MSSRLQTYLGVIIGMLGWMIGLAILCAATGQFSLLAGTLPVGLASSIGLAAMTLTLYELASHRFGRHSAMTKLCMWGAICLDLGILLLLANHWLAPILQANPTVAKAVTSLGGVTSVPDAVPIVLLLLATALLGFAAAFTARTDQSTADIK